VRGLVLNLWFPEMPRPPVAEREWSRNLPSSLRPVEEVLLIKHAAIVKMLDNQQHLYLEHLAELSSQVLRTVAEVEGGDIGECDSLREPTWKEMTKQTLSTEKSDLSIDPLMLPEPLPVSENGEKTEPLAVSPALPDEQPEVTDEEVKEVAEEPLDRKESQELNDHDSWEKAGATAMDAEKEVIEEGTETAEAKKKIESLHNVLSAAEAEDTRPRGERFVTSTYFEMTFGILIIVNTMTMCAEAEYQGRDMGHSLGVPHGGLAHAKICLIS